VMPVLLTTSLMMSSLITRGSPTHSAENTYQVLDAKEDIRDCQRAFVSRKMTAT